MSVCVSAEENNVLARAPSVVAVAAAVSRGRWTTHAIVDEERTN